MFTRLTWKSVPTVMQAVRRYGGNKQFENYYDILQVRRDSTEREIRAAFVNLSKQFHPDTKGVDVDPLTTAKFVKISEAYQVLSRPNKRNAYDQQLWARGAYGATYPPPPPPPPPTPPQHTEVQSTRPYSTKIEKIEGRLVLFKATPFNLKCIHNQICLYEYLEYFNLKQCILNFLFKSINPFRNWEIHPDYDPNPQPDNYYGVEGVEKVSNSRIATILILLGLVVCALGSVSIIQAFDMQRKDLDRRSAEAANYYEAIRADAKKYGNEEQLRRLSLRLSKDN